MYNCVLGYLLDVGVWDVCCWEMLTVRYLTEQCELESLHLLYRGAELLQLLGIIT